MQKYIGEGSRMVRELFVMARQHAPSIIFMDEIDSIGSHRTDGDGDNEVQRTMMELLNQLDGFESTQNIKVRAEFAQTDTSLARDGLADWGFWKGHCDSFLGNYVHQPHRHSRRRAAAPRKN